ncbi:exonuclease V a 5' deoxyribonuclease-domain-containing protein [Coniochaeta sp. 2T2.1]|nr:exonuclease V a 5' deoxyribonuclease-domain-containing protein [Coniochaeta sp. 2T2.1]
MASKLALKYQYSYNSDTDASSDYDFDLTAEEEDLLETIVASASSTKPSVAVVPGPAAQATVGASSLRSDIAAAFATHASVKSLYESEINFNVREVLRDPAFTYRDDPSVLSGLAATGGRRTAGVDDEDTDAEVMAIVEEAERTMPQPGQAGDIRYPDLSRAFGSVMDNSDPNATVDQAQQQRLSPLLRFRSFPKKPFSVSDLVAGAWCELQYFYTLTKLPGGKKTRTAAMKGGSKLHQKLEDEIYTTVTIEITKKEDAFGLKIWNLIQGLRTLRDTGMTRELEVWGLADGHVVNGVIDNLSYENPDPEFEEEVRSSQGSQEPTKGAPNDQKITTFFHSSAKPKNRQIFITDVKTRASRHIPSGAALRPTTIQLFLYHRFLSEMAAGRLDFLRVLARYGLEPDEQFSDTFISQIGNLHDEIFQDAVDDSTTKPASSPVSSTPSSTPDLIRYRTLRQLISLLETELRLTFPDGAGSVGSLVNVEYRKRARRNADGVEDPDDEQAGSLLGANVLFVDPNALDIYLRADLEWWEGKRPPRGVQIEEAYKCRSCEFADECEWRQKQDADILAAVKKRIAGGKLKDGR